VGFDMTSFARAFKVVLSVFLVVGAIEGSEAKGRVSQSLIIQSKEPVLILYEEEGESRPVIVPEGIKESIRDIYTEISVEDLGDDGISELVATMDSSSVNRCSKIYRYDKAENLLVEISFSAGDVCNLRKENGYVVSSYRDEGAWKEDFYKVKDGLAIIYYKDACIGCGEISRVEWRDGKAELQYLVTDGEAFNDRHPISLKISSQKASIYDGDSGGVT
jgi:hypothetical protein